MNYPKLSVLMPCYNKVDTVVEAIRSVALSGYPNLEIVFLDDASTDGTLNIVTSWIRAAGCIIGDFSFSDNFILLRNEVRSGNGQGHGGQARQQCLRAATGDYVANLDCDDVLIAGAFNPQIEFLENHKEYGWCHAPVILYNGAEEHRKNSIEETPCLGVFEMSVPGYVMGRVKRWDVDIDWNLLPDMTGLIQPYLFEMEWEYSFIQRSGCVYRKSAVMSVGGYDCSLPHRGSMQDYDLLLRLAYHYKGWWSRKVTTKVRKDEIGSNARWCRIDGVEGIYDRNRGYIQEKYRSLITRKLEPIPFYHKLGRALSMCGDGFLNTFWPGMRVDVWQRGMKLKPGYDVVYSSWFTHSSVVNNEECFRIWNEALRVDGLLKLIVSKDEEGWVERLAVEGFEVRYGMHTPFKGGSFEVEAIKRRNNVS